MRIYPCSRQLDNLRYRGRKCDGAAHVGEAVMRSERHESLRGSREPLPADPVLLPRREYVPELLENFRFCRSGTTSNASAHHGGTRESYEVTKLIGIKKRPAIFFRLRSKPCESAIFSSRLIASLWQTNGDPTSTFRYRITCQSFDVAYSRRYLKGLLHIYFRYTFLKFWCFIYTSDIF